MFSKRTGSLPRPIIFQENANKPAMTPVIRFRQPDPKQQQSPITLPTKINNSTSSGWNFWCFTIKFSFSDTPPPTAGDNRPSRSSDRSTRKPRIVASLERGSQRVFELLTPRRLRKDNSQVKICKNYVNVSVTNSDSPEFIRAKITEILEELDFKVTSDNWKVRAENAANKIELDIVWVNHLSKVGVKRKRIKGKVYWS